MKKLISLMLALIMVLSLATVVGAEETATAAVDYGTITPPDFTIRNGKTFDYTAGAGKDWNVTGSVTFGDYSATLDGESYSGNVTATMANASAATSGDIVVKFPELSAAGTYVFSFKEVSTNIQGVTISEDTFNVAVTVGYDNENEKLIVIDGSVSAWIAGTEKGDKETALSNGFEAGSFTVEKDVTGTLANENDTFQIMVTITADNDYVIGTPIYVAGEKVTVNKNSYTETLTISESSGQITFDQIPAGVTVTVQELDDNGDPITTASTKVSAINDTTNNGDYTYVSTENANFEVSNASTTAAKVTNNRDAVVATGIVTDSAPYIILIAVCAVAAVAFVLKRRNAVEF